MFVEITLLACRLVQQRCNYSEKNNIKQARIAISGREKIKNVIVLENRKDGILCSGKHAKFKIAFVFVFVENIRNNVFKLVVVGGRGILCRKNVNVR